MQMNGQRQSGKRVKADGPPAGASNSKTLGDSGSELFTSIQPRQVFSLKEIEGVGCCL